MVKYNARYLNFSLCTYINTNFSNIMVIFIPFYRNNLESLLSPLTNNTQLDRNRVVKIKLILWDFCYRDTIALSHVLLVNLNFLYVIVV